MLTMSNRRRTALAPVLHGLRRSVGAHSGLLALLAAYATVLSLARYKYQRQFTARYTFYVYVYCVLLWLMPARQGRRAFWFAHHSALGVYFGINWVWYVDRYRALWEIGQRQLQSKPLIVGVDLLVHGLPVVAVYSYCARRLSSSSPPVNPLGSGFITALFHIGYCLFLRGDLDPAPLYRLDPRPRPTVLKGWVGVTASHLLAEWLLRYWVRRRSADCR